MAIDAAGFKDFFPEFAPVPDLRIDKWLEYAQCLTCEASFKTCADKAIYCLAAHYLSLEEARINAGSSSGSSSAVGLVSAQTVGDVSIQFDNTIANKITEAVGKDIISAELSVTPYGKMYLSMRARQGYFAASTAPGCP